MKKLTPVLFIALALNAASVKAQTKISEGKAVFSIDFPTEGMEEQYKAMVPTETTVYFKGDKSRSETKMAVMNMVNIYNFKDNSMVTLTDGMGKKQAVKTDLSKPSDKYKPGDFKIENTAETKTIAGYNCTKAIVTDKDGNKFDLWFTKDIEAQNSGNMQFKGVGGFPMKYEITIPNMEGTMKMECKSITAQKVPDDMFSIPEGYDIKTQEEMQKQYGK
jgi:GLPGLI family protein